MPKRQDKRIYKPDLSRVDEATLANMRNVYRAIRKKVYDEATKPLSGDPAEHARNKATFKSKVLSICVDADVSRFTSNSLNVRKELWHHLWSKIRYSGMLASRATAEIASTSALFDNYEWFCDDGWHIPQGRFSKITDENGQEVYEDLFYKLCGPFSRDYMRKKGLFANKTFNAKRDKIAKTIEIAKSFKSFFDQKPTSPVIDFVGCGITPNRKNIWSTHRAFERYRNYPSPITALHLMTDIGYAVIKPDQVIALIFFELGWLHKIASLPPGTTASDIIGKTRDSNAAKNTHSTAHETDTDYDEDDDETVPTKASPKSHVKYDHERIYMPIVELSRKIVASLDKADLEADIGWSSSNPLREFDLFMVKYGQEAEPAFGITQNLRKRTPFSTFRAP